LSPPCSRWTRAEGLYPLKKFRYWRRENERRKANGSCSQLLLHIRTSHFPSCFKHVILLFPLGFSVFTCTRAQNPNLNVVDLILLSRSCQLNVLRKSVINTFMDNIIFQTDVCTSTEMFQFIVMYIFVQVSKPTYLFPTKPLSSYSFFGRHTVLSISMIILMIHTVVACTRSRHGLILSHKDSERIVPA